MVEKTYKARLFQAKSILSVLLDLVEKELRTHPVVAKARFRKYKTEDFNAARAHLLKTWKIGSSDYPFAGEDAKILSFLLGYGLNKTLALMDLYKKIDSWSKVNMGLSLKGLRNELKKLLDNPMLKMIELDYDRRETKSALDLDFLCKIPKKENWQDRKMEVLNALGHLG